MSDFKVGDRVRVVVEDDVVSVNGKWISLQSGEEYSVKETHVVSVEKIVPPIKVGDVITNGHERYVVTSESSYYSYDSGYNHQHVDLDIEFNSSYFRVVGNVYEIGE